MSKTSTASCKTCGNSIDDFYAPGYCSEPCYSSREGEILLNKLRHDHKFCATCGTQLKTVEPPTDKALLDIDGYYSTLALEDGGGFQYRTKDADPGEITVVCGHCGNITLNHEFPEVQLPRLLEYAQGLIDALHSGDVEDATDVEIDQREFYDHLIDTQDVELSLGRAIADNQ